MLNSTLSHKDTKYSDITILEVPCSLNGSYQEHNKLENVNMFDLLKNKDWTGQLGTKGLNKNLNSCPHWTTRQLFLLRANCLKYQNIFFPPNIVQIQNFFDTLNYVLYCFVLYCHILFCPVFIFCRSNRHMLEKQNLKDYIL
jgi:hypothetical protein